jgi:hypothetical protein
MKQGTKTGNLGNFQGITGSFYMKNKNYQGGKGYIPMVYPSSL